MEDKMKIRDKIREQIAEIEKTLYGLNKIITIYCLSKATDLTVMLLGGHGTAKSSLARMWSITTGLDYRVVQSAEVDESLIAYIDIAYLREKNIVRMKRGELMEREHIIIDEFFLWLNKFRAKLHQLLEERTYSGLDVLTKTYTFLTNPFCSEYYAGQIEDKNFACYSEDTDILTLEGWKTFKEIKNGEKIFTLNPETQQIELEEIKKKIVLPYSGKMYSLDTQEINLLVTPNHRMYIAKQEKGNWKWQVRRADEIFGTKFRLLKTGKWLGSKNHPKEFMALMGWYLAKGRIKESLTNSHYGICFSVCKRDQMNKVVSLAKTLGYNPHVEKKGNIVIWNKELWEYCKKLGKDSVSKNIPSELKAETPENLKALLFSYFDGGGWQIDGQWLAKTVSKRLADDLQEVALKCGYSINLRNIGKYCAYSHTLGETVFGKQDVWLVSLVRVRNKPLILGKDNKSRIRIKECWQEYSGNVYCVSTSNGIVYVRRNGKPYWSGNSFDRIDVLIPVFQPKIVPSETMIRKFSKFGRKERPLEKVVSWDDYLKARTEIMNVEMPSRVVVWLSLFAHALSSCKHIKDKWSVSTAKMKKLCAQCNENAHLCAKASLSKPRFFRATILLAKALAWLDGRDTVSFEDINEAIQYTLPHRIVWLQEELSYLESIDAIQDLYQQFNDEMLAWKNREIFSELAKVIEASKKIPPIFQEKEGQALHSEVSEIHLLSEFITETLQSVKEEVTKYYYEEGQKANFKTLQALKEFLIQSGLGPYDREELMYNIASKNANLFYSLPSTSENIIKLVDVLIKLHRKRGIRIEKKELLTNKLQEHVTFDSELIKMREYLGDIQILFKNTQLRDNFLKLWKRCENVSFTA